MTALSAARRAKIITDTQLWPRIARAMAGATIRAEVLAEINRFAPQYAQIIAGEESGDAPLKPAQRLSWDARFEKLLRDLGDGVSTGTGAAD